MTWPTWIGLAIMVGLIVWAWVTAEEDVDHLPEMMDEALERQRERGR
ncbi:MAG: hypothetical protein ACYCOR_10710 [Acidobacteriaceae bacterium]